MKHFLIATLMAASTLVAANGHSQSLDRTATQQFVGNSAGSFGAQQAAMYNQSNGQ